MEGRWTIVVEGDTATILRGDGLPLLSRERAVPVVPCDDAAIERAATLLLEHHLFAKRPALAHFFAARVLAAAGETP